MGESEVKELKQKYKDIVDYENRLFETLWYIGDTNRMEQGEKSSNTKLRDRIEVKYGIARLWHINKNYEHYKGQLSAIRWILYGEFNSDT